MIVQISDIFVVVTAAAIFFSIRLLISAFFYPPFTIRTFSSASAIRRYPVRVLQTPSLKPLAGTDKQNRALSAINS